MSALSQADVDLADGKRFWRHVARLHRTLIVLLDDEDRAPLLWGHRFVQNRWSDSCQVS